MKTRGVLHEDKFRLLIIISCLIIKIYCEEHPMFEIIFDEEKSYKLNPRNFSNFNNFSEKELFENLKDYMVNNIKEDRNAFVKNILEDDVMNNCIDVWNYIISSINNRLIKKNYYNKNLKFLSNDYHLYCLKKIFTMQNAFFNQSLNQMDFYFKSEIKEKINKSVLTGLNEYTIKVGWKKNQLIDGNGYEYNFEEDEQINKIKSKFTENFKKLRFLQSPFANSNFSTQTNTTINDTAENSTCNKLSDCFNCTMHSDDGYYCDWSEGECTNKNKKKDSTPWHEKFNQCTSDINSLSTMRKYCGEVFDRFLPFESRLRLVNNLYADQNLYCKWRAINTDPTQNINLNITKFNIDSQEKYFIEIIYYDGSSNLYEFTSKYFYVTSTAINFIILHFYSPEKSTYLPFSASFEYADGVNISTNYLNIFIIVGLVILGCVILTIFLHRCSKFFSRHNAQNISNNSSRINQQMGNIPATQRIIQDLIEEREEYQNRMFLREEKKRQKNLAALDNLFSEKLKTMKFCDKEDKEFTNCTICLEDYTPEAEVITLLCRHTFHYSCLKDWLLRVLLNPKCPNCNDNLIDLTDDSSSESESESSYVDSDNSRSNHGNNDSINNNNNNMNANNNRYYGRNNTYTNLNRNNNNANNSIINNVNRTYSRAINGNVNNYESNRSEVIIVNNRSQILDSNNNNINDSRDYYGNMRSNDNLMYIQHNRSSLNNHNNSNSLIRRGREDAFNNLTAISIESRSLNNGDNFVINSNNNANTNLQSHIDNNRNNMIFRHDTNNFVLSPEQIQEDRM